ncbi:uncharacterized protein LOC114189763 [Vigna unguiculata]|uniref:Uncharacterized protein n=1 Tax=Vigna unguiculata TaxID=3917 RepID=A0A4D6N809_VIGUN|nr:uncharacterized protein LOC114189763 [Vigna unguiculata]QCE08087.1 hypothetical protein DEO72_LG9g3111 [Vigna unguiculata]
MQISLDSRFLLYLLLIAFFLGALVWLFICNLTTRGRGIEGSFLVDDEGDQNAVEAEIRAGGVTESFNVKKKGKQNLEKAKIICGGSNGTADSEQNYLLNILFQVIAYLFGGGPYGDKNK